LDAVNEMPMTGGDLTRMIVKRSVNFGYKNSFLDGSQSLWTMDKMMVDFTRPPT
jgi:hypothetical protein